MHRTILRIIRDRTTPMLQDIIALLAISNPLGALPVFLAIAEGATAPERLRAALRAALAATVILTVAAVAGRPILAAFGISMPALQAATVLTLSSRAEDWRGTMMLLIAVVSVGTIIGIVLGTAGRLGSLIGARGQRILLRFMGLILAAVGAEVLLAGVYTFVPRS
jgi:small neutral amino acid transporter SnatA (MarC family)